MDISCCYSDRVVGELFKPFDDHTNLRDILIGYCGIQIESEVLIFDRVVFDKLVENNVGGVKFIPKNLWEPIDGNLDGCGRYIRGCCVWGIIRNCGRIRRINENNRRSFYIWNGPIWSRSLIIIRSENQ